MLPNELFRRSVFQPSPGTRTSPWPDNLTMSAPMWIPSEQAVAQANITSFMQRVEQEWGIAVPDYDSLYRWSIDNPDQFWLSLWDFCSVIGERGDGVIINNRGEMFGARFFPEARLNFAENLLRRRDRDAAVIYWSEDSTRRSLSYSDLYDLVSRLSQALQDLGIRPGDRVAAVVTNSPEALSCMLAVTSLGAIWSSCSPDYGVEGIVDRVGQIEPKLLIVIDQYIYKAETHNVTNRLASLKERIPSLDSIIVIPNSPENAPAHVPGAISLQELMLGYQTKPIGFIRMPFDHPSFVVYSSGTTGVPKCIVHAGGRVLIQLVKEHALHFDTKPGSRFFFFTTAGWNVWYTLVGALAVGATIVMYDGSPFHPREDILFDLVDTARIAIFGISPRYIERVKRAGAEPIKTHDLSSLKAILSSGAPLSADNFDYVYSSIKRDVQLSSASGGTEIMTTFANGNPIGPVWRGELQVRTLGMKVEVFSDTGESVREEKGELVCTGPFPSQPLCFWKDPGDRRYFETYFSRFPNVWCHGDFAEITAHDGIVIYGRSDSTLNPGGIRIGTAEIYRPVEAIAEVEDSIVIGQGWGDDVRVVLFVKLRKGLQLGEKLKDEINRCIREHTTPRHIPALILQVPEVPYTVTGKKVERAVRDVVHNRPVENIGALANPEALRFFRDITELEK